MTNETYLNAAPRYRKALVELHFRADAGVPAIHCPATGRAVLPRGAHLATEAFERDPVAYLDKIPTVLWVYLHEAGEFLYLRDDVSSSLEQIRTSLSNGDADDWDLLVEHTPDFGGALMVIDVEETAPGGHHACATIGLDLARALKQR